MSERKYRLKRDLPDAKAGIILSQDKEDGLYMYRGMFDENEESWYIKEAVETNPDWFEEIIPQRTKLLSCNICGGELVMIRGRYPKEDKRQVCPTCNTERLEQINEISSKLYGVAMQETKITPIS